MVKSQVEETASTVLSVKGLFLFRSHIRMINIPCLIVNFEHAFFYDYKLGQASVERILKFEELTNQCYHKVQEVNLYHKLGEFYLLKNKRDLDSINSYVLKANNSFYGVTNLLTFKTYDKNQVSLNQVIKI